MLEKYVSSVCVIGHISNCLPIILVPLLDDYIVTSITGTVTGPQWPVTEGVFDIGGT